MMDEVTLILYSTEGCHLCEEAEALLRDAKKLYLSLDWKIIDIAYDDALFEHYGWLIPVLQLPQEAGSSSTIELQWPFDSLRLHAFLHEAGLAPRES